MQTALIEAIKASPVLTLTTRSCGPDDEAMSHVDMAVFATQVRSGDLICPMWFGGHYYAWGRGDLERFCTDDSPHGVVTARPYTALLLTGVIPSCFSFYLTVDSETLAVRRKGRSQPRDVDASSALRLRADDAEVARYAQFFTSRVEADENAPQVIRGMLGL